MSTQRIRYEHTYPLINGEYVRVAVPIVPPITRPVTPAAVISERARQLRKANGHNW